jgi:DNA-binding NtrC family response regulator
MLDHAPGARASDRYPNLREKQILVVEDDVVIAADYHFQLREVGGGVAGLQTGHSSCTLATHDDIDAVIVDYRLRDCTSEPILKCLVQRAIPFVIVTGHAFELHASLNSTRVLSKPVAPADIWSALSALLAA